MYWSIDNCNSNATTLQANLDIAITHFQNDHSMCHIGSHCKEPEYIPSFTIVRDQAAVKLLTNFLHGLTVYKYANDFVHNRDTYFIESLNNATLQYLGKRIHYRNDSSYLLRFNLAVLDWNEHVERPYTSISKRRMSVEHSRRQKGAKVYKKKTFNFVERLWSDLLALFSSGQTVQGTQEQGSGEDTDPLQDCLDNLAEDPATEAAQVFDNSDLETDNMEV